MARLRISVALPDTPANANRLFFYTPVNAQALQRDTRRRVYNPNSSEGWFDLNRPSFPGALVVSPTAPAVIDTADILGDVILSRRLAKDIASGAVVVTDVEGAVAAPDAALSAEQVLALATTPPVTEPVDPLIEGPAPNPLTIPTPTSYFPLDFYLPESSSVYPSVVLVDDEPVGSFDGSNAILDVEGTSNFTGGPELSITGACTVLDMPSAVAGKSLVVFIRLVSFTTVYDDVLPPFSTLLQLFSAADESSVVRVMVTTEGVLQAEVAGETSTLGNVELDVPYCIAYSHAYATNTVRIWLDGQEVLALAGATYREMDDYLTIGGDGYIPEANANLLAQHFAVWNAPLHSAQVALMNDHVRGGQPLIAYDYERYSLDFQPSPSFYWTTDGIIDSSKIRPQIGDEAIVFDVADVITYGTGQTPRGSPWMYFRPDVNFVDQTVSAHVHNIDEQTECLGFWCELELPTTGSRIILDADSTGNATRALAGVQAAGASPGVKFSSGSALAPADPVVGTAAHFVLINYRSDDVGVAGISIDGAPFTAFPPVGPRTRSRLTAIGSMLQGTNRLGGKLADIAIWNRNLTNEEAAAAYAWVQVRSFTPFQTEPPYADELHEKVVLRLMFNDEDDDWKDTSPLANEPTTVAGLSVDRTGEYPLLVGTGGASGLVYNAPWELDVAEWCIEFQVTFNVVNQTQCIVARHAPGVGISWQISLDGGTGFKMSLHAGGDYVITDPTGCTPGTPAIYAFCNDPSGLRLYRDTELVATAPPVSLGTSALPLGIAGDSSVSTYGLNGKLKYLRVTKGHPRYMRHFYGIVRGPLRSYYFN